jgi:hypothetical protein
MTTRLAGAAFARLQPAANLVAPPRRYGKPAAKDHLASHGTAGSAGWDLAAPHSDHIVSVLRDSHNSPQRKPIRTGRRREQPGEPVTWPRSLRQAGP